MPPRGLIPLAVCVLTAGCLSEKEAVRVLRKDHPREQTAMMARITREGMSSMTGDLIRLLEAEDEGVRFMAATSLHQLTGIDRGFHFAEGEKRKAIVAQWHRWYEAETGEPVPDWEPEPPHPDEKPAKREGEADPDAENPEDAERPDAGTAPAGAKEAAG